jgi:hypothetical protein
MHPMILKPSVTNVSDNMRQVYDIFCQVIDNFGDAGVCLRLARALVLHHAKDVRLWCDNVCLLKQMESNPPVGLSFHLWHEHVSAIPASAVVCGFGCSLDEAYLQAMVAMSIQPAYIHLEYLSAEPWVQTTHGLTSIHPRLGLVQRFCNPGFNDKTGGLLHECAAIPKPPIPTQSLRIFFFAYDLPVIDEWITAVKQSVKTTHSLITWVLPHSAASVRLHQQLQHEPLHQFERLPFVSQLEFDAILDGCDIAWVRGEDSAMTAMFSGLPMIWQLYPQDDVAARNNKLTAYIDTVSHAVGDDAIWVDALLCANQLAVVVSAQEAFTRFIDQVSTVRFTHASMPHQRFGDYCRHNTPDLAQTIIDEVQTGAGRLK